jgi:hypothetical protein
MVETDNGTMSLDEAIDQMAGYEGWWKRSGPETMKRLAEKLCVNFSEQEAFDILSSAFWVGKEEYGG